ncbi:MAG: site-specific integrase [Lacibacter sp.]|jgi:vacuolar-type H+-ATPase subunit E/Vma4
MEVSYYLKRPSANKALKTNRDVLRKPKTRTVIYARICYNNIKLKFYTNETIDPNFWNPQTQRAKQTSKFTEHPEFNRRLDNIAADIRNAFRNYKNENNGEIPSPETFKEILNREIKKTAVKNEKKLTLLNFFEEIIKRSREGTRLHHKTSKPINANTLKTYATTFKHLTEFQKLKRKEIDFQTVNLEFYSDYTEYLIKTLKLSTNTVGKHIQIIKMIMNEATETGDNTNLSFKGKRFITVREDSDNIYLTQSEIDELSELDLSNDIRLDRVRDLFLIGCYTGLRYSDYSTLEPKHFKNGFIEVKQSKTGHPVTIPMHQKVKGILAKYDGELPKSISNQKTNDYLKELASEATLLKVKVEKSITKGGAKVTEVYEKWELLTTHTARRSFATNQYLSGVPTVTIMAITGHKTEKSFLRYIKLSSNEHAKLLKMHWDNQQELKAV